MQQLDDVAGGTLEAFKIKFRRPVHIRSVVPFIGDELCACGKNRISQEMWVYRNVDNGKKDIHVYDLTITDETFDGTTDFDTIRHTIINHDIKPINLDLGVPVSKEHIPIISSMLNSFHKHNHRLDGCHYDISKEKLENVMKYLGFDTVGVDTVGVDTVGVDTVGGDTVKEVPGYRIYVISSEEFPCIPPSHLIESDDSRPVAVFIYDIVALPTHDAKGNQTTSVAYIYQSKEPGFHVIGSFDSPIHIKMPSSHSMHAIETLIGPKLLKQYSHNKLLIIPDELTYSSQDGTEQLFSDVFQTFFTLDLIKKCDEKYDRLMENYGVSYRNPEFLKFLTQNPLFGEKLLPYLPSKFDHQKFEGRIAKEIEEKALLEAKREEYFEKSKREGESLPEAISRVCRVNESVFDIASVCIHSRCILNSIIEKIIERSEDNELSLIKARFDRLLAERRDTLAEQARQEYIKRLHEIQERRASQGTQELQLIEHGKLIEQAVERIKSFISSRDKAIKLVKLYEFISKSKELHNDFSLKSKELEVAQNKLVQLKILAIDLSNGNVEASNPEQLKNVFKEIENLNIRSRELESQIESISQELEDVRSKLKNHERMLEHISQVILLTMREANESVAIHKLIDYLEEGNILPDEFNVILERIYASI